MKVVVKMDRNALVETVARAGLAYFLAKVIYKSYNEIKMKKRVLEAKHQERKRLSDKYAN